MKALEIVRAILECEVCAHQWTSTESAEIENGHSWINPQDQSCWKCPKCDWDMVKMVGSTKDKN